MEWSAILKTLGLCLISTIIEAISATKDGKKWLENMQQPKNSFSSNRRMPWQASIKIDRSELHYSSDNQFMLSYCQILKTNEGCRNTISKI